VSSAIFICKNLLISLEITSHKKNVERHNNIVIKITKKQEVNTMNNTTGKKAVPEAREALNRFKYEVASEIGVPLKQGYNGDLTSAQNGYVGGYMVKKMIEAQERAMSGR